MRIRSVAGLAVVVLLVASLLLVKGKPASAVPLESPNDTQETPTLFDPDPAVMSMAVANGAMFWSTYEGCPGVEFPVICKIREKMLYGPYRTTIFDNTTGSRGNDIRSDIAADGEFVYWVNADGNVVRKSRHTPATTAPTFVIAKENPASGSQVAVDDTYVYWTENVGNTGKVFRALKTGGSGRQLMTSSGDDSLTQLSADGRGGVFFVAFLHPLFCCNDTLHHVTPNGSGGNNIDRGGAQVKSYAFNGDRVNWATNNTSGGLLSLLSAPLSNLASTATLYTRPDNVGNPEWRNMTIDSTHVYWHEFRFGSNRGDLFRLRFAGGAPEGIVTNLTDAAFLTGDDRTLFWLNHAQIFMLPKTARALTADLSANELGLEVVQVIQSQAHDVPLVLDKPTFVRVYGRLAANNQGLTQIPLFPPVLLHGLSGGVPLPGSPLMPLQSTHPTSAPVDRTTLVGNYLFQLPPDWTRVNTLTLRAEINPRRTVSETNYANNVTERTVTLRATQRICLDMLPVLTTAGQSGIGSRLHQSRAKALLPVPAISHVFLGGPLRTKPVTGDIYNAFEDDDIAELLYHLMNEFMFTGPPSQCAGYRTIRTVSLPGSLRFGKSNALAPIIVYLESYGGSDVNFPDGGVKGLAHELGHQFGRAHVLCPVSGPGAPGWPYETYPYPPCQLDSSNNHIGLDPITKQLIVPLSGGGIALFSDVMSYSGLQMWSSDSTYRYSFQHLRSAITPLAPAATSEQQTTQLLIGGYITPDGHASIQAGYEASGALLAEIQANLAETTEPTGEYQLRRYGAGNVLIGSSPVVISRFINESEGESFAFFSLVSTATALTRLELVRVNQGVIAERAAGANPPTVAITQPAAGTSHTGTLYMSWTGTDPDGDALMYQVRYSNDNGANWMALTGATTATSLVVDLGSLPGGVKSMVSVMASDGLHSAAAQSGLFSTATHGPQATITGEDMIDLSPDYYAGMAQSSSLHLGGAAYDAEDGNLTGPALQWQLSGPMAITGQGEELVLREMPPGLYDVTLRATDKDNQMGEAHTRLMVAPKYVADSADITLDGFCNDPAYTAENDLITLRYEDNSIAQAALVRSGGELFACFSGLAFHNTPNEAILLKFDVENDGGALQDTDDLLFVIRSDGQLATGKGNNGGADVMDALPQGLAAAIHHGSLMWEAEIRIDASRFGGWNKLVRLQAVHRQSPSGATFASWPRNASYFSPATWGLTALGRLNQSIVFDPLSDRMLGQPPFQIEATATSNLPVRLSSTTPAVCAVQGTTVTLKATGACTITARQDGSTSYAPANVSRTFIVRAADHMLYLPQVRR